MRVMKRRGRGYRAGAGNVARPAIQITPGQPYGTGYGDEDLRQKAETEGNAQIYTPAWGDNRQPYPMHEVVAAADTNRALQGHELFGQLAALDHALALLRAGVDRLQAGVVTAIGSWEQAQWRVLNLEHKLEQEGLALPERQAFRLVVAALLVVGLAFGELFILSPAFQILGLSDRPLIYFLPFTAQHVAALSGVVALLVLAHALAERHSDVTADDRGARSGKWYDELAARSAGYRINMLGVLALLLGLAAVREVYLAATGQGNVWAAIAFLLLNLGVVIAARWAARPDPRPYAVQWQQARAREAKAEEDLAEVSADYEGQIGEYNATLAHRNGLIHQYGQAFAATGSDARRQNNLLAGHTRLSQPEPVAELMFDDPLPQPDDSQLQNDVRTYSVNEPNTPTPFRRYEELDTTAVTRRYELMEQRLATCRFSAATVQSGPTQPLANTVNGVAAPAPGAAGRRRGPRVPAGTNGAGTTP